MVGDVGSGANAVVSIRNIEAEVRAVRAVRAAKALTVLAVEPRRE